MRQPKPLIRMYKLNWAGSGWTSSRIPPSPPSFALTGYGWQAIPARRRRMSPEAPTERREIVPMWYVYFLELSNRDIYVGSTNDLRRRFKSHQQGHVISTRLHLPVV